MNYTMRVVSPIHGTKRGRPNGDEEQPARRVLQRTASQQVVFLPGMVKIVKQLNESEGASIVNRTMSQLVRLLYCKDGDNRPQMQEAFFNAGGHLAVVTTMTKHPMNRHLQHEGIRALTNATCNNVRNKIVVAEIGGLQATAQAMQNHSTDKETQRLSLKALNNLIHRKEHAKVFVGQLGGATLVIKAMNDFVGDANVVQKAVVVILKLCWMKRLRPTLMDANVVAALASATEHHVNDENIQQYVREALDMLVD